MHSDSRKKKRVGSGAKDLLSPNVPATKTEEDGGEGRRERQGGKGSEQRR